MHCFSRVERGGEARVLIVDDDESIRQTLTEAFRDDGYDVDAVDSARAALESVRRRPPDVILLDMRMPDDGPAFEAALRKGSCDAPIIAMSASLEGENWARAIDAKYVKKPFTLDDVFAAVRAALRKAA